MLDRQPFPHKLRLIELAYEIMPFRSFADLGACWGVHGAYAFHAAKICGSHLERGCVVDGEITPLTRERAAEYPGITLIEGALGAKEVRDTVGETDCLIMYDVLLHQVDPDWDRFILDYLPSTRMCIVYNQNWTRSEDTIRFVDKGIEWFKENVYYSNEAMLEKWFSEHDRHDPHQGKSMKDVHNYWQWGIVRKDIVSLFQKNGFTPQFIRTYGPFNRERPWIVNEGMIFVRQGSARPEAGSHGTGAARQGSGGRAGQLAKAGEYWDRKQSEPWVGRTRFWQHPGIIAHINEKVCGEPLSGQRAGVMRWMEERLQGETLGKGISVGCGIGGIEMAMLESGLVQEFDVFELSEARIREGRELARKRGLEGRIRFNHADGMTASGHHDLVFWGDALHHMLDVHRAVEWSSSVLRPGGMFVMDDFIGPSRLQWTDFNLQIGSRLRRILPDRLLADPKDPSKRLPVELTRMDPAALIAQDPTEAADSERILGAVRAWFPDADVILTGGCIYFPSLDNVLANMTPEDAPLLDLCLVLDDLCTDLGHSLYAVAIARKGSS